MIFKIILRTDTGKILEELQAEGQSELIRLTWFVSNLKLLYNCEIVYKEIRYVNGRLTEIDSDFPTMVSAHSKLV